MSFESLNRIIHTGICCGCGSCVNSCVQHLITMVDDDTGFLYPAVEHPERCTACDFCTKSCPIVSSSCVQQHAFPESISYHGHVDNMDVLSSCSSGGLATALSKTVIEKGGVVFGVRYSDDFTKAMYEKAQTISSLENFKGSKYIQPETGTSFREVKHDLDSGRLVLFIGLPCVISGLKTFLKKEYENLITCDLICYGVTSPKIASEYIHDICSRYKSVLTKFSVRYKKDGLWLPPYIRAEFVNNTVHMEPFYHSDYGWGFTQLSRPSCYQCFCKEKGSSVADITFGDAKGCGDDDTAWNSHGVSVVFAHTKKGSEYLDAIQGITICRTNYLQASDGNPYLTTSREKSRNYDIFSAHLTTNTFHKACSKTYPLSIKILKKLPLTLVNVLLQNKKLYRIYKYWIKIKINRIDDL